MANNVKSSTSSTSTLVPVTKEKKSTSSSTVVYPKGASVKLQTNEAKLQEVSNRRDRTASSSAPSSTIHARLELSRPQKLELAKRLAARGGQRNATGDASGTSRRERWQERAREQNSKQPASKSGWKLEKTVNDLLSQDRAQEAAALLSLEGVSESENPPRIFLLSDIAANGGGSETYLNSPMNLDFIKRNKGKVTYFIAGLPEKPTKEQLLAKRSVIPKEIWKQRKELKIQFRGVGGNTSFSQFIDPVVNHADKMQKARGLERSSQAKEAARLLNVLENCSLVKNWEHANGTNSVFHKTCLKFQAEYASYKRNGDEESFKRLTQLLSSAGALASTLFRPEILEETRQSLVGDGMNSILQFSESHPDRISIFCCEPINAFQVGENGAPGIFDKMRDQEAVAMLAFGESNATTSKYGPISTRIETGRMVATTKVDEETQEKTTVVDAVKEEAKSAGMHLVLPPSIFSGDFASFKAQKQKRAAQAPQSTSDSNPSARDVSASSVSASARSSASSASSDAEESSVD